MHFRQKRATRYAGSTPDASSSFEIGDGARIRSGSVPEQNQKRAFIQSRIRSNRFLVAFAYCLGEVSQAVHSVPPCVAPSITKKSLSELAAMSKYCSASRMK